MQGWEIVLLPIAAAAIAAFALIRRRYDRYPADGHVDAIKCEVAFTDWNQTLEWIQTYFEDAQIEVTGLETQINREGDFDLYTNVYTLRLPEQVNPVDLVGRLSGYKTVLSVHTGPV